MRYKLNPAALCLSVILSGLFCVNPEIKICIFLILTPLLQNLNPLFCPYMLFSVLPDIKTQVFLSFFMNTSISHVKCVKYPSL